MTTQTNEAIETLEAEIEELKHQRGQALTQVRRAEARFGELEKLRTEFSPKAFAGDEAAVRELEAIEDEHDALARSVRVAKSALPEFDRMLEEVRAKLAEEEREVIRRRIAAISEEMGALDPELEEAACRIKELLGRQSELRNSYYQELRQLDQDRANRVMRDGGDHTRVWLQSHFGGWLG